MLDVTTCSLRIRRSLWRPRYVLVAVLSAGLLAVGTTACGGSASKSSATSSTSSTATQSQPPTTATAAPTASGQGTASVRTGPVRGTLKGENHDPLVNRSWRYSLTVTDASGHPLNGTVDIEFAYDGQVVGHDTPPTHPVLHGRWQDSLEFPAQSVGMPLSVQAVVHTSLGSITLDWPIVVKR